MDYARRSPRTAPHIYCLWGTTCRLGDRRPEYAAIRPIAFEFARACRTGGSGHPGAREGASRSKSSSAPPSNRDSQWLTYNWLQGLGLGKYAKAFEDDEVDFEALPPSHRGRARADGAPHRTRAKLLRGDFPNGGDGRRCGSRARGAGQRRPRDCPATTCRTSADDGNVLRSGRLDEAFARRLDPEDFRSVIQALTERGAAGHRTLRGPCRRSFAATESRCISVGRRRMKTRPSAPSVPASRSIEAVKAVESPESLSVRVGISHRNCRHSETGPRGPVDALGCRRRYAPHCGSATGPSGARFGGDCRGRPARLISARFDQEALGPQNLKGIVEPISAFLVRQVQGGLEPLPGCTCQRVDPSGRATNGACAPATALARREGGRRAGRLRLGCARHREIADRPRARAIHRGDTAFQPAVPVLAPSHTKRTLPRHPAVPAAREASAPRTRRKSGSTNSARWFLSPTDQVDKALPFVAEMIVTSCRDAARAARTDRRAGEDPNTVCLVELLLGLSERGPVFCLFEDAQWIDPSTQELLDLLVSKIREARILLIVTHRPENQQRSGVNGNVTALSLSRLRRSDVLEMAQLALRTYAVSIGVVQRVIDEKRLDTALRRGACARCHRVGWRQRARHVRPAKRALAPPGLCRTPCATR